MEKGINAYNIFVRKNNVRDHLGDLDVDVRVILKQKYALTMWTRFIWLRI
jgi:hypothetical protein